MDAISNPTSSLLPTSFLQSNPKDSPNLLNLHRPITHHKQLHQYFTLLSAKPPPPPLPFPLPNLSPPLKPRPQLPPEQTLTHRRAATGYAAALADAASCDGVLAAAGRDARRLMRRVGAVLTDPAAGDDRKAAAVVDAAGGGMYGKLVALVRMLVRKGKVGLVREVMEEFGRICAQLSGAAATAAEVVVVAAERRMEEAELAGIARAVQRKSGAEKVKYRDKG
ncbi:uncharacterized protein [Typha latifolia]|uniref:uncharacterized protein isoform X1 n=1 Tax=Typha latifolia TaxID=4733 RepID=UPI003C2C221E